MARSVGCHRRRDIQGLRALAVLVVVAFHAGLPVPGGFIGVDVFFVISGFVITGMLKREWDATGRASLTHFYMQRFKRLTPALSLMVSVVLVASALFLSPFGTQQVTAETAIGATLLFANFVISSTTGGYFDAPAEANPLLNTWSLSVEEQFYLVFPVMLALGWLLARRWSHMRFSPQVIVGGITVFSFALAILSSLGLYLDGMSFAFGFYSPFTRAWEFAAGALLALSVRRGQPIHPKLAEVLGLIGLLLLIGSLWLITDATPFPGVWTLLPVSATLLIIAAGYNTAGPASRWLSTRTMVWLGDRSYSIYLWHWPVIVFAAVIWPDSEPALLAAACLSFVPAFLAYQFIERPIRVMVVGGWRRFIRLLAVSIAVPTGLAIMLLVGSREAWWIPWPEAGSPTDYVALANCTD